MALDLIFITPGDYTINDNGVPADNTSVIRDGTGAVIFTFAHPVDSLGFTTSTPGVNLTVNFTDSLGAANLTIGSLADTAVSPESISFGNVRTTGIVSLAAVGAITERGSDVAADIIAGQILLSAGTGIGTGANALETRTSVLEARTATGGIAISNVGQLQIGGPASDIGGLQVTGSGDISLTNVGSIFLAETTTESVRGGATSGDVTLIANGSGSNIVSSVDRDAITATGGSITLQAAGDIAFGIAGANFDNDVRARGAITIIAGNDFIVDGFADMASDDFGAATGGNMSVTAGRSIIVRNVTGSDGSITASGSAGADVLLTTGPDGTVIVEAASTIAVASNSGDVVVHTDRMLISGPSGVTASNGGIFIRQATAGREIDLGSAGDAAFALELSDAELDRLFTPTVTIGDNQTGLITVSAELTPANASNMVLRGSEIAIGASITTLGALELRAGDNLYLTAASAITAGGALSIFIDAIGGDGGEGGFADLRTATLSAASITINGAGENDTIYGAEFVDQTVHGHGGNDRIISSGEGAYFGNAGDDVILAGLSSGLVPEALDGGDGVDTLDTRSFNGIYVINLATGSSNFAYESFLNFENVITSDAADQITGGVGTNRIETGGGNDILDGAGGSDILIGGQGDDTYHLNVAGDLVFELAGQGYDIVNTITHFDVGDQEIEEVILGGALSRNLTGGAGANILRGNAGANVLEGRGGADTLEGGDGLDTASYAGSGAGVTVSLGAGTASGGDADGDTLTGIENLTGSAHADALTGDSGTNVLTGGEGDDTLTGGGGNDSLLGGLGVDNLSGGADNDLLDGGDANDSLFGGTGDDTIQGGLGSDNLNGAAGVDTLAGGDDADTLNGGEGDDILNGGTGNDILVGGAGADTLQGGDGVDIASYVDATGPVVANLTTGVGTVGAALGDTFSGIENLTGSIHADTLVGDTAANSLNGGEGDDLLNGGLGDDLLVGGAGAGADRLNGGGGLDTLNGGGGADTLNGGADADLLTGGSGNDLFVFRGASGSDVIADFAAGAGVGDVISLDSAIFTDFADVLANTANDGLGNTIISKGGVSIQLNGVLKAQLNADDFTFGAAGSPARSGGAEASPLSDDLDPLVLPAGMDRTSGLDKLWVGQWSEHIDLHGLGLVEHQFLEWRPSQWSGSDNWIS